MIDIGRDLQNAFDEGYEEGYKRGRQDEKVGTEMSLPKWIPVSEKPKEEEKAYLVQLDGGGMRSCRWTNVNHFWTGLTTDWHWNIFDIPQYCKVVAWMDLEPYRKDNEEYKYALTTEQIEHDALYEPTYNPEDGSM